MNKIVRDKIIKAIRLNTNGKLTDKSIFDAMAQITAEVIGIDNYKVYTINELISEIMDRYNEVRNSQDFNEYIANINSIIANRDNGEFDAEIKKYLVEGKFLIYHNIRIDEDSEKSKKFRRFIAMTLPKISIANIFMSLLIDKTDFYKQNQVNNN